MRSPASPTARATASRGISSWVTRTAAAPRSGAASSTSAGVSRSFAPGTTAIEFSPSGVRSTSARPVGAEAVARTLLTSTCSARSAASCARPSSSSPTRPTIATVAPQRAAATAWLAPLPPGSSSSDAPPTVSPGPGRRSTRTTWSALIEPTTTTKGWPCASAPECGRSSDSPRGFTIGRSSRAQRNEGPPACPVRRLPAAGSARARPTARSRRESS